MSKRLIVFKNVEGRMVSTSSYQDEDQESEDNESPGLVVYEFLRSVIRKQCMYPFQLLKQFILFSQEQSSIEVDYKYMRCDLQLVQINIQSVCDLFRQKLVIHGFLTIKHAYEKRLRVDEAYYNQENLVHIQNSMLTVQQARKMFFKWEFFDNLYEYCQAKYQTETKMKSEVYYTYQNLEYLQRSIETIEESKYRYNILEAFSKLKENHRGFKLSKISLSKIEIANTDFPSKEFDQFQQFLNHKPTEQIIEINSFIIEKHSQHAEESSIEQPVIYEGMRIEKNSGIKSYEFKNEKVTSEKSLANQTPSINNSKIKERGTEELENKILVTEKKEGEIIIDQASTHKQNKNSGQSEAQQIYLIRERSKKKRGPPTNFIKIPLTSQNVKIVEIQTERKKRKRESVEQRVTMSEKQCINCRFCEMQKERKEIMKKVQERLISSQTININIIKETSHNSYHEEDHEHSSRGNRSGHFDCRVSEFRHDFNEGGPQYEELDTNYNTGTVMSERVERGDILRKVNHENIASTNLETYSNTRSSSFSHTLGQGLTYNKRSQFLGK